MKGASAPLKPGLQVEARRIAGTKTLTHATLVAVEALGYTIEVEAPKFTRATAAA